MDRFRDMKAGELFYGQQKLVELAQVLMLDPKRHERLERRRPGVLAAARGRRSSLGTSNSRILHAAFSEPELVQLGYAIAFRLGQLHFERTGV
jgi:hypothetical protein